MSLEAVIETRVVKQVVLESCVTCFIREVNAPFGKPNPIAAISATT